MYDRDTIELALLALEEHEPGEAAEARGRRPPRWAAGSGAGCPTRAAIAPIGSTQPPQRAARMSAPDAKEALNEVEGGPRRPR